MVEYGNGVGQVSGQGGGGGGGGALGGGPVDLGARAANFVTDTVDTISALPPGMLLLLAVGVLAGLIVLRRVF
jgi:hypothetical protein